MDGIHDCGGMDGFGPVRYRKSEPVFEQPWEGRTLALLTYLHIEGISQWDKSRWYREQMGARNYVNELDLSYYTHWLSAAERLLVDAGIISEHERAERVEQILDGSYQRSLPTTTEEAIQRRTKNLIKDGLAAFRGAHSLTLEGPKPSYSVGDKVTVHRMNPATHTRCPRYVRGVTGVVATSHGCQIYPDSAAVDRGPDPQPLYTVQFAAKDLWGQEASDKDSVYVDLWEPYLAPAA